MAQPKGLGLSTVRVRQTSNVPGVRDFGIRSPDGSISTELTVTVVDPRINNGRPTNIPSIFGGRRVSEREARDIVADAGGIDPDTGRTLPGFASIAQAETAAIQRSQAIEVELLGNPIRRGVIVGQPRGIGLAETIRETDTAAAGDNTLTRLGNALTGTATEVPQFEDNPLGAIGFVLSNFAAGVEGRELPTERIRQNALQQRQLELQQLRVTLNAVKEGVDLFVGLDPADPTTSDAINRFASQFVPVLGEGFRDSLTAGLELARNQGREAIEGLVEHRERIQGICGLDRDCIQSVAGNASLMAQLNESADRERLPGIVEKFDVIGEIVGNEAIDALKEGGFTLADLQRLPGDFAFTPDEIRTISRNTQVQDALIPLGFQAPDIDRIRAEETARQEVAEQFRGQEVPLTQIAKLNADLEAGRITPEQHSAAILKATTVTGRTPEDIRAQAAAERTADDDAPIPTALANLVGVDPALTIGEARAQGIAIPRVQDLEKLQLQRTDVQSLVREARNLIGDITGRPEVVSAAGGIARAVNSLRSTAEGLLRSSGVPISVGGETATVDQLLNEENYRDVLQELGVTNSQVRSRMIGLAFAAAAAAGQTGRGVSDRDIELFIRRIGDSADPTATINVLKDLIEEADLRFQDSVENATGKRPGSIREEVSERQNAALQEAMEKSRDELTQADIDLLKTTPDGVARLRQLLEGND